MAAIVGVATSKNKNSYHAGRQAAEKALGEIGHEAPDFVLVFSTEVFDQQQMIEGIKSLTGSAPLVGCCGAGIITGEGQYADSVAVMTVKSDEFRVATAFARNISRNPRGAGEEVAEGAVKKLGGVKRTPTLFIFPDGFTCNISEVVKGAYDVLGPEYHFIGGGSGDNLKFFKSYQFVKGSIGSDCVAAALIDFGAPVGIGVAHGWTPVGRPLVVTKSRNKTIKEIDGKPAFEAYLACFDGTEEPAPEDFPEFGMRHPLGLPDVSGKYVIRDPLRVSEDGSITCVAEVPENSVVRIMKGDSDSVIRAAENAAKQAVEMIGGRRPAFAVVFDCVSRLQLLSNDAQRELRAVREIIGKGVPVIGFLTFGEIASAGGPPAFHNKSIAICVVAK